MSANVPVYVKVVVTKIEWVTVQAVTLSEAMMDARHLPGVGEVLEASYEEPETA